MLLDAGSAWQAAGVEYIMQPRMDKLYCVTYPLGGGAGPTSQAQRRHLLQANAAKLGMVSSRRPTAFPSIVA